MFHGCPRSSVALIYMQVHRIRENCVQQMERIHQGYAGQVKYLRGVRVYGTQQLTTIREQYNDQVSWLK